MQLQELRRRRFLSRDELARMAEVSPTTVLHVEQGKVAPKMRTARRIAQALDVDPTEIDEFRALLNEPSTGLRDVS